MRLGFHVGVGASRHQKPRLLRQLLKIFRFLFSMRRIKGFYTVHAVFRKAQNNFFPFAERERDPPGVGDGSDAARSVDTIRRLFGRRAADDRMGNPSGPLSAAAVWSQIQTGLLGLVLQAVLVPFIVMGLGVLLGRDAQKK